MPTSIAEPTIDDLLEAFGNGVRAQRDRYVDAREGAIYQHWSGVAAILWSRNARRTTDLFRAVYFDSAEAQDLTSLLSDRYDFDRIPDSYGVGTAHLRRPTAAAADGTIWRGTRISLFGTGTEAKRYVVSVDVPVAATKLIVPVPIRAEIIGPGTAIRVDYPGAARVDDPLWDATWNVDSLECDDGTAFEPAARARARLRDARLAARPGFVKAMIEACKAGGADTALLFSSDYAGDDNDFGLNFAYVGDAAYFGDERLCRKIAIALEGTRVLGDQLQVRPLTRVNLTVSARVYLWDSPTRVAQDDARQRLLGAILGYFNSATDGFSYRRDAIAGAMMKACPEVESVEVDIPASDAGVVSLVGGLLNFPATLPRYFLSANDVTISLLPPL